MSDFILVEKVRSYQTKQDKTASDFNVLIAPSQNVLINDQEKISTRPGYTLLGAANTGTTPIESSYDWENSSGDILSLRGYDDELEVYVGTVEGIEFNAWEKLKDSWTYVDFQFASVWNGTEKIDLLVFVGGDDNLYDWSGAMTTFASCTANTITKQGTGTWGSKRFLTSGTRQVKIKDTSGTWRTATYTGGEGTTALTGTTNMTGFTFDVGALVMQEVRTNSDTPAANYINDTISVLNNQVWVGSETSKIDYVSTDTSHTTYTYSTPRVTGEGAQLVLDSAGAKFARQGSDMFISAGRDDWYKSEYQTLEVGTGTTETLKVKKLKTTVGMGALSQNLIVEAGDFTAFIDHNQALRMLGTMEEVGGSFLRSLSDPIKPDFEAADFTGGNMKFHKNRFYISCPNDDKVFILEKKETASGEASFFWQPPQILPVRQFAVISGNIHGHSSYVPESYRLFYGDNDNGNAFVTEAVYSYRNYQNRDKLKTIDEWLTEGFLKGNTKIQMTLKFEYEGAESIKSFEIDGNDQDILFQSLGANVLADQPLSDAPLADNLASISNPKFRCIKDFPPIDCFEIQVSYRTDTTDAYFEIICQGGNARLSKNEPTFLRR